jgi:hypothetical protein
MQGVSTLFFDISVFILPDNLLWPQIVDHICGGSSVLALLKNNPCLCMSRQEDFPKLPK